MKAGLLGAIGGLGQAMQTVGSTIVARREKALEEARQMAKYERERADKLTDKNEERDFTLRRDDALQDRQDARHSASLTNQAAEGAANRTARREERVEGQNFRASEAEKDRSARKELTRLTKSLERENSAASTRLTKQLSAGDVSAVQYGAPNEQGYAEVFVVTKSGAVKPTGQRVYRPAKQDAEDEGESL